MTINGIALLGNRDLWKRAVCQYERQEIVKELQRFHHTSERYKAIAARLALYDAETARLLGAAGMITK